MKSRNAWRGLEMPKGLVVERTRARESHERRSLWSSDCQWARSVDHRDCERCRAWECLRVLRGRLVRSGPLRVSLKVTEPIEPEMAPMR